MTPSQRLDLTALISCIEDDPGEYARELLALRESNAALVAACKVFLACPPRDRGDIGLEAMIAEVVAKAEEPST